MSKAVTVITSHGSKSPPQRPAIFIIVVTSFVGLLRTLFSLPEVQGGKLVFLCGVCTVIKTNPILPYIKITCSPDIEGIASHLNEKVDLLRAIARILFHTVRYSMVPRSGLPL